MRPAVVIQAKVDEGLTFATENGEPQHPRVPQLFRQVVDFIMSGFKTLHYKRDICCVAIGFLTPSA